LHVSQSSVPVAVSRPICPPITCFGFSIFILSNSSNNLSFFIFLDFNNGTNSPFPAGCAGSLLDTFGSVITNGKSCIFAAGFPVPSRGKHHNICDLRCLVAGNIAMRSVKHQCDAPAWAPFFFGSAIGLLHTMAERYPMKLFFPSRCRSEASFSMYINFFIVLLSVQPQGCGCS